MRKKAQTKADFNPYQRYENALRRILSNDSTPSGDAWENKVYDILKLRESFKQKYGNDYLRPFEQRFPLYASLLTSVEDTRTGGDRDLLEAVLLTSLDLSKIDEEWKHSRFDRMFLGLYRKLFYDVTRILGNKSLEFQYIVAPMTKADSDKLAVGHIWKILALVGGMNLLKRKGLGTDPIKAEDIAYLLHLASYRHCSNLLQYTSQGKSFFMENPAAAMAITALADFDGVRANGRRADYLAELSSVAKNNLNSLLNGELRLISVPEEEIAKLVEFDGTFRPDITNTLEYSSHVTFIDSGDSVDE